jgi:hypothetical protein
MLLEGLGQLKISNNLIVNRTRDLPAGFIVPLPTALLRSSNNVDDNDDNNNNNNFNIIRVLTTETI